MSHSYDKIRMSPINHSTSKYSYRFNQAPRFKYNAADMYLSFQVDLWDIHKIIDLIHLYLHILGREEILVLHHISIDFHLLLKKLGRSIKGIVLIRFRDVLENKIVKYINLDRRPIHLKLKIHVNL